MNIQSLQIVVPNKACINRCAFCVSRMHCNDYEDRLYESYMGGDFSFDYGFARGTANRDYVRRLMFARDNGCDTIMLTGTSEPQQNPAFLNWFAEMNSKLPNPFHWFEIQTTGAGISRTDLDDFNIRYDISTLSLSVSALDDEKNRQHNGISINNMVNIKEFCKAVKSSDLNLRLSINMTKDIPSPKEVFGFAKEVHADQLTLRKFYSSNDDSPQAKWVFENKMSDKKFNDFNLYVVVNGRPLERMPYGFIRYSVNGISVVINDDCMATDDIDHLRYLILRENCRLYTRWDDPGSLLF